MRKKRSLRIPIGFLGGLLFLWRAKPTPAGFVIGTALIVLGEAIRFISHGTLRKNKGVISQKGIYAYTRNPLYIGSFLIGIGACVMGMDLLFTVLFLVFFIPLYSHVIIREERFLALQFGEEYIRYRDIVPRIIPRRLDVREVMRETSSTLAFRNREGKTMIGIAAVLIIMIVKMLYSSPLP